MKRKGVIVRWDLKEAWSKHASRWTRTGFVRPTVPGERADDRKAHIHQRHWW